MVFCFASCAYGEINAHKGCSTVLRNIIKKREPIVGLDIGASAIKLVQLDLAPSTPALKAFGSIPMPSDAVQGNSIKNPERVADAIRTLWHESKCSCRAVSVALPGGSVFVKAITVPRLPWRDLREQVALEVAQFIPYDRDAISIDFQVLRSINPESLEVLVVAAKNEILGGYLEAIERAGLTTMVVDVDCFALQNCFEYSEPEQLDKTTALIDIGARFSSLHIVREGRSLRIGDVLFGAQSVQVSERDAAALVSELAQQLSLLCSSEDEEIKLDGIRLNGGGSVVPGVVEILADTVQIPVRQMTPHAHISIPAEFNTELVESSAPFMAIAVGLALRCPGDHIVPEYLE